MEAQTIANKCDWLFLMHRFSGLIFLPFLLISCVLAVALTHVQLLNTLSEKIYPSLPIPQVRLNEPVQAGSWDQALRVVQLVMGKEGHAITMRDENTVIVQGFEARSAVYELVKTNSHPQFFIDTRTMRIVRVQDKNTSLVALAHGIHAVRFFGIGWFSIATVSAIALLMLLVSGGALAWRDRKAARKFDRVSFWHVRLGQVTGAFVVIISLTTLQFEFKIFGSPDSASSLSVPVAQFSIGRRQGSVDQARQLAAQLIGALPRGVFIFKDGGLRFSEAGDGIGGKSVLINSNNASIDNITDWRNYKPTLMFILHDGRWLGGMNALNVNDVVVLILLFLSISGCVIFLRKRDILWLKH